jgi:hypothetical protein
VSETNNRPLPPQPPEAGLTDGRLGPVIEVDRRALDRQCREAAPSS